MSPGRPIHILVVDDEPYLCELSKEYLEQSEDMKVEIVSSVSDARTILGQRHFDAIISDYQMPKEDGLQFLRSLRQKGDDIPFVLFTGRGREEVAIEALNNGADSYLQKGGLPVPVYTELEHRVRKAVQRQRAEEALLKSAADLREAQEIAHMGRWELDLVTGHIEWSDGIFTIFEVDPKTFTAAHDAFLKFTHPEDRAIVDRTYREFAEKGIPYDFAHRLLRSDGSTRWVSEIGRTLYDDAGSPVRFVGTIQDITDRKRSEASLKDSVYARRLIDASLDPLLAIGATGMIIDANAATSKLTGVSRGELIGADLSRFFTDPQKAKEGYLKVFEEGEVRDYPATLIGPSGRYVAVTYNASAFKDENERVKGVFVAVHDVTEHKRAEEQLIQ
ncbi:MAG: PAS domain S-box protein, partial [Methanomassiliicoccales archaeon]